MSPYNLQPETRHFNAVENHAFSHLLPDKRHGVDEVCHEPHWYEDSPDPGQVGKGNYQTLDSEDKVSDAHSFCIPRQQIHWEVDPQKDLLPNVRQRMDTHPAVHTGVTRLSIQSKGTSTSYYNTRSVEPLPQFRPVLLKDISLANFRCRQNINYLGSPNDNQPEHIYIPKVPFIPGPKFVFAKGRSQSVPTLASQSLELPRSLADIPIPSVKNNKKSIDQLDRGKVAPTITEDETSRTQSSTHVPSHTQISTEAQEFINELAPMINIVSSRKSGPFLAKVLKKWHSCVTLDELFHLLYGDKDWGQRVEQDSPLGAIDKSKCSENRSIGRQILLIILDTYKGEGVYAHHLPPKPSYNREFSFAVIHESLRNVLAMKLLLSTVQKVKPSNLENCTISRLSLYKVYFILCQKLLQKYPRIFNYKNESFILGSSQLGKIMKCVYPDMKSKRLGKRGESKVHYCQTKWNNLIVGEDVLDLLSLDLTQIQSHFQKKHSLRNIHPKTRFVNKQQPLQTQLNFKDDAHSYIHLSQRFPKVNCSPSTWISIDNDPPKPSDWAQTAIKRSLTNLEVYGLELLDFIQNFDKSVMFEGNKEYLAKKMGACLQNLREALAPEKVYMHLYLVIFLKILPLILASSQEMSVQSKTRLGNCLKQCTFSLDFEIYSGVSLDGANRNILREILGRMVHLNEMTSCMIEQTQVKNLVKEIARHIELVANVPSADLSETDVDNKCIQAIILSTNAHNYNISNERWIRDEVHFIGIMSTVAHVLQKATIMLKEKIVLLPCLWNVGPLNRSVPDLIYQVFKLMLEIVHEVVLADSLILQFPVTVITSIILHLANSVQYATFGEYETGKAQVSKEARQCLLTCHAMFHDYIGILSEVAALSEHLNQIESMKLSGDSAPMYSHF